VATLNICGLPWSLSSLPPLAERAAEFGRRLNESDLDVINMQEVWGRRQLELVRANLPSFPHVAWHRGLHGQPAGGLATFSRRPLTGTAYHSYRGSVPRGGDLRFRAKRALNGALQGVLTTRLAGPDVLIANTHLTANKDGDWSDDNRYHDFQRTQVGMLHAILRKGVGRLTIVTGDFNIPSYSSLYPLIVADGAWRDPFATTNPATFHPEFLPPGNTGERIDYALVSGEEDHFPVRDSRVLFAEPLSLPGGRRMYLSDHKALAIRVGL
jgi:exonuclease III